MHDESLATRTLRTYLGITLTAVYSVSDQLLPSCLYSPVPTRNRMLLCFYKKPALPTPAFFFPLPLPDPTVAEE